MTDFDAIDALLAAAKQEVPLPPPEERRRLREGLYLSRAQLSAVLGVSPSTVGGWESGRDPGGETREKYAYFLEGAAAKLDSAAAAEAVPGGAADDDAAQEPSGAGRLDVLDDVDELPVPQACVLCGQPARHQVEGFPQHLDPAECAATAPAPAAASTPEADLAAPGQAAPKPAGPGRAEPPRRRRRRRAADGRTVTVAAAG